MKVADYQALIQILVVLVTCSEACNISIVVRDVVTNVTSPGYPRAYGDYVNCWWRIEASSEDKLVGIKHEDYHFDIGRSTGCTSHSVSFYDGINSSAPLLSRNCGSDMEPLLSSGRNIYVHFLTKSSNIYNNKGFKLNIFQVEKCGGELTATSERRYFTSPGYPHTYFNNMNCTWIIKAENESDTIRVQSYSLSLQSPFTGFPCFRDVLTLYNGHTMDEGDAGLLGRLCALMGANVHSSKDVITVNFRTDSTYTDRGFNLSYTTKQEGDCNITKWNIYSTPTFIYSPGYPDAYYNNLNCYIHLYSFRNIRLHITNLDIEGPYPNCNKDALTVYKYSFGDLKLGTFCGDSANGTVIYSKKGNLFLRFTSDNNTVRSGYRVEVTALDSVWPDNPVIGTARPSCGEPFLTATSSPQYLQSPGYPTQYYNHEDCGWIITASHTEMKIRIEVIEAEMEGGNLASCQYDYVEIIDGLPRYDAPHYKLCSVPQRSLQSSGSRMTVKFHTDQTGNSFKGFRLKYFETAESICGGSVNATTTTQSVKSPNYPSVYRSYLPLYCIWRVYADRNTNIKLTMPHFDIAIGKYSFCSQAYVTIYDGTGTEPYSTSKLCGSEGRDYISSENSMTIKFYTDGSTYRSGFNFRIQAGEFPTCPRRTVKLSANTAADKTLLSPNYPFSYPINADCTWLIDTSDKDYIVKIYIQESYMDRNCSRGYVEAFDGEDDSAQSLGRWCSDVFSNKKSSTGRHMFLKFKSDSTVRQANFKIRYSRHWQYLSDDVDVRTIVGSVAGGAAVLFLIGIVLIRISYKRRQRATNTNIHVTHVQQVSNGAA